MSTSKPEKGKTFLVKAEAEYIEAIDDEEWDELNEMQITITIPENVACGVYLPALHSGEPNHSGWPVDQREVLLPAGTCFKIIEKKIDAEERIEMKMECLEEPCE